MIKSNSSLIFYDEASLEFLADCIPSAVRRAARARIFARCTPQEAEELAQSERERALCSNACLLARALETQEGEPVFSSGREVLSGLRVEEIAAFCRYAYVGFFLQFLWNRMEADIDRSVDRLGELMTAFVRSAMAEPSN